jgi:hypothetical protein
MKPETEVKLVRDFPQIFRDWGGNPMETCMSWGLEVGEGWVTLIRKLCDDIMATNPPEDFKAEQVKEKFGGLRFYWSGGTDEISKLVDSAEAESYKTCENCGSKENITSEGAWITTLCKECRRKPE